MRKCESCIYRTRLYLGSFDKRGDIGCGYILYTGKMRGCDPEECDKYVKGKQIRVKRTDF